MKILASDYDHTFYRNEEEVKLNVEFAKEFMKNNLFMITTGRSYLDFTKKKQMYNIPSDYLVINHGSTIIKENKNIYNIFINDNIKDLMIKDLQLDKSPYYFACSGMESRAIITDNNLTKIHVEYENQLIAGEIKDIIMNKYNGEIDTFYARQKKGLEIVSKQANKAYAIEHIAGLENITRENIYTVGDDSSDIEMLKKYNGYAMDNATDEVLGITSNRCHGVYELIRVINK